MGTTSAASGNHCLYAYVNEHGQFDCGASTTVPSECGKSSSDQTELSDCALSQSGWTDSQSDMNEQWLDYQLEVGSPHNFGEDSGFSHSMVKSPCDEAYAADGSESIIAKNRRIR